MNKKSHCRCFCFVSFLPGSDGIAILCKIQSLNSEGSELSVNLNEVVYLNCSVAEGAPASTITWKKEINDTNGRRIFQEESKPVPGLWSSLRINNVTVKDAGRYKCTVKRDAQEDDCEVTLRVKCK